MIKNREESSDFGKVYKQRTYRMPGGSGRIVWDSFNCLTPIQTVVWLKICETMYKSTTDYVTISEPWLNRNFQNREEWRTVVGTLLDLEDIGFIECTLYRSSILVRIQYDKLSEVLERVGRERGAGMRIVSLSKDILSLTDDEIYTAKLPPIYKENGSDVLKKIIDEVCE